MRTGLLGLVMALLAVVLVGGSSMEARAAPLASGLTAAVTYQSPVQPVLVWRDCQRIARCSGCKPVYRCRSCSYQRQCPRRGPCAWTDVCVWGPYLPVAPRGVPIIPR